MVTPVWVAAGESELPPQPAIAQAAAIAVRDVASDVVCCFFTSALRWVWKSALHGHLCPAVETGARCWVRDLTALLCVADISVSNGIGMVDAGRRSPEAAWLLRDWW